MNLILIDKHELSGDTVTLIDRRFEHIKKVLRPQIGDSLKFGIINGALGSGRLIAIDKKKARFQCSFHLAASPAPPTDLILAVPRPIMLKRVLAQAASLGVENIFLIKANRVEKSFFNAKLLDQDNLRNCLLAGLEQSGVDSRLPKISVHHRFRPFAEDLLPEITHHSPVRLIAHPTSTTTLSFPKEITPQLRMIVAIGPEGGWVDFEIEKFIGHDFTPFCIGPRILRVDTVVPAILAQLDLLRRINQ